MNPRDLFRPVAAFLLATAFAAAPAAAAVSTVQAVLVRPAAPTTCDAVTLAVQGSFGGCDSVIAGEALGPEPIPDWVGPLPAYRWQVRVTILHESSPYGCIAIIKIYTRDIPVGTLPTGQHFVTATERVVDPQGTLLDSSVVNATFTVTPGDSCLAGECALLRFAPHDPMDFACDASTVPGSSGRFWVALGNRVPVAGVQARIQITDDRGQPLLAGWFTPTLVTKAPRATDMDLAWEADGSAVNVMLYSTTGAAIAPGFDRILSVVYQVGAEVPVDVYPVRFEQSLVADEDGDELPPCPTFREATGRFCVGYVQGCDVNGDGGADIRDIVRLVRCALSGPACPDTIRARADCDANGAVDVRDVICCVRKLLDLPLLPGTSGPSSGPTPLRIGFAQDAVWTTSIAGRATIVAQPGAEFGGVEFEVVSSDGIRITGLETGDPGYRLDWVRDMDGRARAVLLRQGTTAGAGDPRITVGFERTAPGAGSVDGELRLANMRAATWDGAEAAYTITAGAADIPAGGISAPAVYAARPNPFAGTTEVTFALPAAGRVSLRIFDVAGRLVRTLVDGERPSGVSRAVWDGKDRSGRTLPAGIYFAKLSAAGFEGTTRVMKLK